MAGDAGQGVEQVGQVHQAVVALHGIPVQGKGVLVVVALVFLHQEIGLDAPTVTCTEVAAFVEIVAVEWLAGEPGVACGLGQGVGLGIDQLPGLLTHHHMEAEVAAPALVEGIVDGVDPGKALAASPPVAVETVGLQGVQRVVFLPDRGQVLVLEHDHEPPVVLMTALHHRPVGVEAVEQQQDRQPREQRLDPLAQAQERALLAVLFVGVGIALGVLEEFAQQGDHQAVLKGQVGLQDQPFQGVILCLE